MTDFVHLHTHTHYSILNSVISPKELIQAAVGMGMKAVAVTNQANVFDAPELSVYAKESGIKLIVGSEIYMAPDGLRKKEDRATHHLVLIAKNKTGYKNLSKILSISATEGFYYRPRGDRELIEKYSEGLICLTACEKGELPKLILKDKTDEAKKFIDDYKAIFKDDFYFELEDHFLPSEKKINTELIKLSREFGVKLVATNDVHYVNRKDSELHEILLCMQGKKTLADPTRIKLPNDEFYFKSQAEMSKIFAECPEAISTTMEIVEKCEFKMVNQDAQLPKFEVPAAFADESAYLRQLTYDGVAAKYGDANTDVIDRIEYELATIAKMGFSAYFLIVSDLINAAKAQGISVGLGRGSAAGSIVAYLTGITNVDPLKYNLLFERFLNPERVSMPDIDIDFAPWGRAKVVEYAQQKYGVSSVSKVIAFGTMAAKAAIKDVARVLSLPLEIANQIVKLVPSKPGTTLEGAFQEIPELDKLRKTGDPKIRKVLDYALKLEGTVRQTSMHAAGVVITPGEVSDFVPLYVANKVEKDDLTAEITDDEDEKEESHAQIVTQFDKDWIEKYGLLKIDVLGLITLSVIDECLKLIEKHHGFKIDIDKIPIDDKKTFKMFQDGRTLGIFQFESAGMQEYLRKLVPTNVDDIIAMNALYRPGPMDLIPIYVDRKHGRETVEYPHEMLKPILEATYGIPVYQEQVMQMAQVMGGYTLGGADLLRRAMSKKKADEMEKHRGIFRKGAAEKGVGEQKANDVFDMMEKFAGYGFNKSHSAAYGIMAYQTGYLKANYPAEYFAAIMTSEMRATDRVKVLADDAKRFGIKVLPPSISKSEMGFSIETTDKGTKAIRFALGAVKNVGHAGREIIRSRRKRTSEAAKNIFEFCSSVDLRVVNKRALESLVESGAMDELAAHRSQLLASLDLAVEYGQRLNRSATTGQSGLFGEGTGGTMAYPDLPKTEEWSEAEKLLREKNLIGFYISSHPLEKWRRDYDAIATLKLGTREAFEGKRFKTVVGIITETKPYTDKKGNPMLFGAIEDFYGKADFTCFASTFEKYERELKKDEVVVMMGDAEADGERIKLLVNEVLPIRKARDRFIKRVSVTIDIDATTEEQITGLKKICEKHTGEAYLYLFVNYQDERTAGNLKLFSRKFVIEPSDEALDEIENLLGIGSVEMGQ
jgi:DNA polymerase-3 subunit alpha